MAARARGRLSHQAEQRFRLGVLLALLGMVPLSHVGCGQDGTPAGYTPFAGAHVCRDDNSSVTCESTETGTDSNEAGEFHLPRSGSLLLVQVAPENTNLLENRPARAAFSLLNAGEGGMVTVWTTLAWSRMKSGAAATLAEAREQIRMAFALTPDFDGPSGPARAEAAAREQALAQLALAEYAHEVGVATTEDAVERARVAAQATYAAAARLNDILDWTIRNRESPPPTNAGPDPKQVFWSDYDRVPISTNMTYGIGFDDASTELAGRCLSSMVPGAGLCENRGEYNFELVDSEDDVASHLEIGAAAKAGVSVGGFDVVSVSGGFRFLKDTAMNRDHLYVAIRDERVLCGYPQSAVLAPEYENLFATNYSEFRNHCGDRYLSNITTGGYFYALIDITLKADQHIEEERLNLSGKVLGVKVFDKTWTSVASEISRDYRTSTRVVSNFFAYDNSVLSMPQVLAKYDEFIAHIEGPCQEDRADLNCPYMASFAPYATATTRVAADDPVLSTYLPNMRSYERFCLEADNLLTSLADAQARPREYNIGTSVDQLHQPNSWSVDLLAKVAGELGDKRRGAYESWLACQRDISTCTGNAVDIAFSDDPLFKTWLGMKLALPEKKFSLPSDCRALSDLFGVLADDEYTMYLGELGKTYAAACLYMPTASPLTYLVLENTSPGPDQPSYNHIWVATGPGSGVGKIFRGLLVSSRNDLQTASLEVTGAQADFSVLSPGADSPMRSFLIEAPVLSTNAAAGGIGTANLNLVGTSMHVGPDPVITLGGSSKAYRHRMAISADRKNVDVVLEPIPGAAVASTDQASVYVAGSILLEHD